MAEARSGMRMIWAGIAALAVAVVLWWSMAGDAPMPEADADAARTAPPDASPVAEVATTAAAPVHRIAEAGRLSIDADALPVDRPLVLGLALSDEARGVEPRSVRIVGVDGRAIETTASQIAGAGAGVRVEIDPSWLRPGRYMIEVKTAEKTHFPLRRYVLEVQ